MSEIRNPQRYIANSKVKIAQRVRQARDLRGWTQEDVAELLSCSRTKLNRIENGRAELTASEIALLARTFKVPVNYFFAR